MEPDTIEQAKGIVMERYKLDAAAAFGVLVRASQRSNRKLSDIAPTWSPAPVWTRPRNRPDPALIRVVHHLRW